MKPESQLGRGSVPCLALSLAFLAAPVFAVPVQGQRPLDHADVLQWNRIEDPSLSPDGGWVAYSVSAMEGDPSVRIRSSGERDGTLSTRGVDPVFTSDSRFVVFRVPPFETVVDSLKREGQKSADLPKDSLGVANLAGVFVGRAPSAGGVSTLGPIESFKVSEEGPWIAFLVAKNTEEPDESGDAEEGDDEAPSEAHKKEDGHTLVVRNLLNDSQSRVENVTEYAFSENGATLAYTTSTEDGSGDGAHTIALVSMALSTVHAGIGHYKQIAVSDDGSQVAFLTNSADWEADEPEHALYLSSDHSTAAMIAASDNLALPSNWIVSANAEVEFSDGGGMLHFGTAPRPVPEPDNNTPEDERVSVDVWNWKDPYLQPMQLVQLEEELKRTYAAVVHLDGELQGQLAQLGTPAVPTVRFVDEGDAPYAIGSTDVPYRQLVSWDGRYQDIWSIDLRSGESVMLAEAVRGFGGAQISPAGKYATWWDGGAKQWKAAPTGGGDVLVLSGGSPHPVWNELDDHPDEPPPYGSAGWTEGDRGFVFYDRHDVYRFDPESGTTLALTNGEGRERGMRFRYAATDPELEHVPDGVVLWQTFDLDDKRSGFSRGRSDQAASPNELIMGDKRFAIRDKADDADRWLVTREDFSEFPDLLTTEGSFKDLTKVSNANPQQSDYSWGSA
ncbi:MAG: hypothetical protein ACI9OJ_004826, partial [Myxococcota bacterium]